MQAYDLIMLIVIGMATIFGAIKGFAWQVASLASVIVSYIVAYRFRFQVAEMIDAKPPWNQFLAMLILYVGTSFVIWVGFRLLSGAIDRVRLKEFDRHLGAGFGFAKGLLYCLLITMFAMSLLGPRQQSAICQSRSGYYISVALDRGVGILPKEIHDVVEPYLSGLDDKLNNHEGLERTPAGGSQNPAQPAAPFGTQGQSVLGGVADAARQQIGEFGQQISQQIGSEISQQVGQRLGIDPGSQSGSQLPSSGLPSNGFPQAGFPATGSQPTTNQASGFPSTGFQQPGVQQSGFQQPGFQQSGIPQNGTNQPGTFPSTQPSIQPGTRPPVFNSQASQAGQQQFNRQQQFNQPAFPGTSGPGSGSGFQQPPQRIAQPGSGVPGTGFQR